MFITTQPMPAVRPSRILFLNFALWGAVTEDDLQEMHDVFGWSIHSLRVAARKMGITIEAGRQKEAA